jgi:hypothetical protein
MTGRGPGMRSSTDATRTHGVFAMDPPSLLPSLPPSLPFFSSRFRPTDRRRLVRPPHLPPRKFKANLYRPPPKHAEGSGRSVRDGAAEACVLLHFTISSVLAFLSVEKQCLNPLK